MPIMHVYTYPYRRAKTKVSCQRLGAFKMATVSKKKLTQKNKSLATKLKAKGADKSDLKRRLKEAENKGKYWENMHATAQEEKSGTIQIPTWLRHMMDPNRPKGTHAPEFILTCMRAMGNGSMASRVNNSVKIFYESTGIVIPDRNFPDQVTQRRWRYGMHYICMVQVGEVLTRAIRNGDKKMAITSDGSPVSIQGLCSRSFLFILLISYMCRSMDITLRAQ